MSPGSRSLFPLSSTRPMEGEQGGIMRITMTRRIVLAAAVLGLTAGAAGRAEASITLYADSDLGVAAGGLRPNSDAAAGSFDAAAGALGLINLIDFEGQI